MIRMVRRAWLTIALAIAASSQTVIVAAVGAATRSVSPAMARPAEGRLAIDAGIGGRYRAGADVPVRVTITADRLIHDTLRVRTDPLDGLGPEIRVAVAVAGGSTKVVRLVVPTFGGNGPLDVSATLASDQSTIDEHDDAVESERQGVADEAPRLATASRGGGYFERSPWRPSAVDRPRRRNSTDLPSGQA